MKNSLKMASLAALTAATLALPAAAADMQDAQGKCMPTAAAKCGASGPAAGATKCRPKKLAKHKCAARQRSASCAPKCAPQCAPKCGPKN